MVLTDTVAGFVCLYAFGVSKCTFFAGLTGRSIQNLKDLACSQLYLSITNIGVHCNATSFPDPLAQ